MNETQETDGRTMFEAVAAGDSFQVELLSVEPGSTSDGKSLWMPGCRGVYQVVAGARKNWKSRLGQMVKIWRVLPGSGVGCMYLEPMGEVAL